MSNSLLSNFNFLSAYIKLVSSANKYNLNTFEHLWMSLMYIKKSNVPKTELCSTPGVFSSLFEISIPIWVVCVRRVR